MAINKKIADKVKDKTSEDPFKRSKLISLLSRIEEGRGPKREIDKIMEEIKSQKDR